MSGETKEESPSSPTLTFNRVVIIQWLADGEQKTGEFIEGVLTSTHSDIPIKLVDVKSKQEVIDAIATAKTEIPELGVPLIHIEAHGASFDGVRAAGLSDRLETTKENILLWKELMQALADLNIATELNLVVVIAACVSLDMVYTVRSKEPLAFMLFYGYNTKISPTSLENTAIDFYRALLVHRKDPSEAFSEAEKATAGKAQFSLIRALHILKMAIRESIAEVENGDIRDYEQMCAEAKAKKHRMPSQRLFKMIRKNYLRRALNGMLSRMLSTKDFPNILNRLGIDIEALIKEARK